MSADTTFKPIEKTYLVTNSALQPLSKDMALGVITWRVRNATVSGAYLTWGPTSSVSSVSPSAGSPASNTIGLAAGAVAYLELPANIFFISSAANTFEVTPGIGGVGG